MSGLENFFGSIQFGSFINYGYMSICVIIGVLIISIILYFVLVMLRYKHRVRVLEVVGDSIQEFQDKGALIKDKDTKKVYEFRLLKNKCKLPPPTADAYIFNNRGKKIVYIAKISPTDYVYCKPSKDLTSGKVELVPIPQDQLFWMANMIEKDGEKYSQQLKWYNNPVIMFWGTLGITLIILILTFKFAGTTWQTAQATAQNTANQIIAATKGSVGQVVS